ncbi:sodium:calcium antiporter [archaeon]|nr:sodium:calcium antiporter [archaeon]
MALAENALLLLFGLAVLVESSLVAVRSLAAVSWHYRLSEFFTSFLVVGLASTIPELFIGLNAAFDGQPDLGLGVILGSNVIDLTIVIGIVAIYARNLPVRAKFIRNIPAYLGAISLPILLLADGRLERIEGLILIGALAIYVWFIYKKTGKTKAVKPFAKLYPLKRAVLSIPIAVILMFISSDIVATNAEALSLSLSVPPVMIGLFIVALGTCLPELLFSINAVREKHKGLAVGDIFGNVIIDATSSLGLIALVMPIAASQLALRTGAFMVAAAFILTILVTRERGLKWYGGVYLVLAYIAFAALGALA